MANEITRTASGESSTNADDERSNVGPADDERSNVDGKNQRMFTISEVKAMVSERVARSQERIRREAIAGWTNEHLGLEDPDEVDEVKAKLGTVKAEETEAKRYARQLKREQEARAAAEQRLAKLEANERNRNIAKAISEAAGGESRAHVEDLIAVMQVRGGIEIDEDGVVTVSGKQLKTAVDDLLKSRPHLLRPTVGMPGGGSLPPGDRATAPQGHDLKTPEGRLAYLREKGASLLASKE